MARRSKIRDRSEPLVLRPRYYIELGVALVPSPLLWSYRHRSVDKTFNRKNPLQCRKCNGAVLPDQAVCLRNAVWVLRYLCIYCESRWLAVKAGKRWVLVEPTRVVAKAAAAPPAGTTVGAVDEDDSERPAKAA